jgi:hypothetical protein
MSKKAYWDASHDDLAREEHGLLFFQTTFSAILEPKNSLWSFFS